MENKFCLLIQNNYLNFASAPGYQGGFAPPPAPMVGFVNPSYPNYPPQQPGYPPQQPGYPPQQPGYPPQQPNYTPGKSNQRKVIKFQE